MESLENPISMFLALFALYSPFAAVSSYFPIVSKFNAKDQTQLAIWLFIYVSIFSTAAIWVGEPLLELLGITTAALTTVGGIALILVGVPLMLGISEEPPKTVGGEQEQTSWRSVLFMPVTFPLTVGGTTFAIMVSYRAQAANIKEVIALSVASLAYAMVTGITVYASGHLERRVTPKVRALLEKVAGILLTAIAVMLLASGIPRMVVDVLRTLKVLPGE